MNDIKRMTPKEFRELGYLQELNRKFLHPLGLALEVIVDYETGEEQFGRVWDFRDDPEGMLFRDFDLDKVEYIQNLWNEKATVRQNKYNWVIQETFLEE